jgi:hypothetical protein
MNRILAVGLLACCTAFAAEAATKTKAPAKKPVPAATLPEATPEQATAAGYVLYGDYACEFKQSIQVTPDPKHEHYVDVAFGKQHFTMKPVLSSTGAMRLEDVKGVGLVLQIAFKSMLMDVKSGHRLVDDCVSEKQAAAKAAAEGKPVTSMMDSAPAK